MLFSLNSFVVNNVPLNFFSNYPTYESNNKDSLKKCFQNIKNLYVEQIKKSYFNLEKHGYIKKLTI